MKTRLQEYETVDPHYQFISNAKRLCVNQYFPLTGKTYCNLLHISESRCFNSLIPAIPDHDSSSVLILKFQSFGGNLYVQ